MLPDLERVAALIEETAAIEILPRFRRLAAGDVREKGPGDLVTVADEAAEARLTPALTDLLPGSVVLGEEAAAADAGLLNRLLGHQAVWIIDPVDGTSNFAGGNPRFAVMVALARGEEIVAGWIYEPVAGRMAMAEAGEGAWIAGTRLAVAAVPERPGDMSGSVLAGFFGDRQLGARIRERRSRVKALPTLGCAGLEYLRLATGEAHFSLFTKLMPWDHAPGVILHREAGGFGGYLDGGDYKPAAIDRSGLLLAPDAQGWQTLHGLLVND